MENLSNFLNTTLITMGEGQNMTVLQLLTVGLVIIIGIWMARWLEKKLSRRLLQRKMNADVIQLIRRSFYILVFAVLIITAMDLMSIPLTAFAFITGAVAIGIGFGAQNIINNFISGWILMWERPIRIGDFLEVGEMVGTVEAINTRSTRIKRTDGVRILVPNSQLLENTVVNWTLVDRTMRSVVRVGVQYGTDVAKVKRLLEGMLAEDPDILIEPEPNVVFEDFGDSALIFDAYFWIETSNERGLRGVRSNLRFAIDRVFRENDIVIAYPQRDVHIDGAIRIAKENS
ncbi:mechanosensitive ion channel family protein [Pseudomonadota bacterium]